MGIADVVRELYPQLIVGDAGVVRAFAFKATIDAPLNGKQLPPEFVSETRAWLDHHNATAEDIHTIVTPDRVIHELLLCLTIDDERKELPVMLVADVMGDTIRDLRIYHSTWPLYGTHTVRHPVMHYALHERPAEPVGTYHEALSAGDAAAADGVFEPAGSVREPAGNEYTHSGADRTKWYQRILTDGPIVLHLGTITDDGETVVYEFMVDRWGSAALPPQSGAAAYQRGESGNKLVSARIYDDVTPPPAIVGE